jgi:hypothetical protein
MLLLVLHSASSAAQVAIMSPVTSSSDTVQQAAIIADVTVQTHSRSYYFFVPSAEQRL